MTTKIANQPATKRKPTKLLSDKKLLGYAIKALSMSYSPYSNFKVGAAVLTSDGAIYQGANIENASYPLCLCAERTALAHAHMKAPRKKIVAIAIVCISATRILEDPGYPCGACRQVISEFESKQNLPIRIIVGNATRTKINVFESIRSLLPYSFDGSLLK